MWILLGILSSVFLGVYDVFKKLSLNHNAVIPVLFFATFSGAVIFSPFIITSALFPEAASHHFWYIPAVDLTTHCYFFLKSVIVSISWLFAYFAVKNLPITIVTPFRAFGPVWTLIGAMIIFGERLSLFQWIGLAVTISSFYFFSQVGNKEGIRFSNNKWALFMILSSLIGAISGLYDKFLVAHFDRLAMQAWFFVYLAFIQFVILLITWYPKRKENLFKWNWFIPMISVALIFADFIYFYALSCPGALVSIISTMRGSNIVYSFFFGAILFKDKNIAQKGLVLLGILSGVALIVLGTK